MGRELTLRILARPIVRTTPRQPGALDLLETLSSQYASTTSLHGHDLDDVGPDLVGLGVPRAAERAAQRSLPDGACRDAYSLPGWGRGIEPLLHDGQETRRQADRPRVRGGSAH